MTTQTLVRKSFDGITKVIDEAQGLVEAIVNSTGITDLQNDVMEPGCWDGLCKAMSAGEVDYPAILSNHNWEIPVGKVVHAEELMPGDVRLKALKAPKSNQPVGGLRIIGQYNLDTQRGREAYSDASKGIVPQWSVGFMPAEDGHSYDKSGLHRISKVGLWPEVSNVLVGASPGTRTTATKSAEEALGDPKLSLSEKALAIEQAYLQAVEEDGNGLAVLEKLIPITPEYRQGKKRHLIDAETGDLIETQIDVIEEPQPQAETTAEVQQPSLETLYARLLQMVKEELNAPTQHSDSVTDNADENLPSWATYNVSLFPPPKN